MFEAGPRTATLDTFALCEGADACVRRAWEGLGVCASLLSQSEYETLCASFETAAAPLGAVREHIDALVAASAGEQQYDQVLPHLRDALAAMERCAAEVAEAVSVREVCTRLSGELLAEVARVERLEGFAGDPGRRDELVAWGRDQVQAAAEQAQGRNWLRAAEMLRAASERVKATAQQVNAQAASLDQRKSRVAQLSAAGTALQSKGTRAVARFQSLAAVSPPDAAPHKAVIVAAGALYATVTEAVAAWNADPGDTRWDLAALEQEVAASTAALDKFLAMDVGEVA